MGKMELGRSENAKLKIITAIKCHMTAGYCHSNNSRVKLLAMGFQYEKKRLFSND